MFDLVIIIFYMIVILGLYQRENFIRIKFSWDIGNVNRDFLHKYDDNQIKHHHMHKNIPKNLLII